MPRNIGGEERDRSKENFVIGWIAATIIWEALAWLVRKIVWNFLSDEEKREITSLRLQKKKKSSRNLGIIDIDYSTILKKIF